MTHLTTALPEADASSVAGAEVHGELDTVRAEAGAGLIEYTLLIAFIAIVCVAAIALLGDTTGEPFSNLANSGL